MQTRNPRNPNAYEIVFATFDTLDFKSWPFTGFHCAFAPFLIFIIFLF